MAEIEIDRSIPFVDAYHHVTEPSRNPYEWLTEEGAIYSDYLGDYKLVRADWGMGRLLREFYGSNVIKSVHVEAAWSGPDPVDETRYLATVTERYGFPNAYVVLVDMVGGDASAALDAHLAASPLVRGVRIREHPEGDDPTFLANLRACAARGLHFETRAWPGRLPRCEVSARAVPEATFIVGAAGMPMAQTPEAFAQWKREMAALAALPNVHCKVGGLGMLIHDWTVEAFRPWILTMIELFGVERTIFGTNWPVDAVYASYLETVDAYRRIIAEAGLSRAEQTRLLKDNAEAFYRI